MTQVLKTEWKYNDTTAEEIYAKQSIDASKGQKVTAERQAVTQGPVPIPEF